MTASYKRNKKRNYPFKRQLKRKTRRIIFMLFAAAIVSGINYYNTHYKNTGQPRLDFPNHNHQLNQIEQTQALAKLEKAKNRADSRFWLRLNARVIKLLKDDLSGNHHQKFLIKPANNITLLVSHNIDLAPRVPIQVNDQISLRGLYEWNNKGGIIHWTHHDPKGRKAGGWISVNGKKYQ